MQVQGPEFNPSLAWWWCLLVIPVQGRWRQKDPLYLLG